MLKAPLTFRSIILRENEIRLFGSSTSLMLSEKHRTHTIQRPSQGHPSRSALSEERRVVPDLSYVQVKGSGNIYIVRFCTRSSLIAARICYIRSREGFRVRGVVRYRKFHLH